MKTKLYYSKNGEKHCTNIMARMVVAIPKKEWVYYAHAQKPHNKMLKVHFIIKPKILSAENPRSKNPYPKHWGGKK